ncbi:histidine kinase 2 [Telopea speciosissima]|uniref:histidine kinase 2 n=1 Tax=Telopea speciosissima TaxID=54955 RepID=UPI001CC38DA4|nr:histidine kinase 2 [Telopea speciosissima]
MALNCKLSGFNGRLPPNAKPKKRDDAGSSRKEKISGLWEEQARILREQFNVSKNQLQASASLFSKSDQQCSSSLKPPFKCMGEQSYDLPLSNSIAYTLKVCSENERVEQLCGCVIDNVEAKDLCAVRDECIPKKLEPPSLGNEPGLVISYEQAKSSISPIGWACGKDILQMKVHWKCEENCSKLIICLMKICWWVMVGIIAGCRISGFCGRFWSPMLKEVQLQPQVQLCQWQKQQPHPQGSSKVSAMWMRKLLYMLFLGGIALSIWLYWSMSKNVVLRRKETLANMCDERARMLQDQFNVSMNHVHALAILVSTFHHGKQPSAIAQKTFAEYAERTAFERPLTSGVAYASKVLHSEREQFEKQHGWTIKKMEIVDQSPVEDYIPEKLDPSPIQDEYAPVIFSQETVSHIISIDMMSGKEDRDNILRARASGKGVLTSPFKLLKSNHLGVVLTFAVYNTDLPPTATPEQHIEATEGYLGASYDVPSLVEKLLHQLASKQTIVVNVYDTTNVTAPIKMYGPNVINVGMMHVSNVDFGDPLRRHEMHCRFKEKPPLPWMAITSSVGALVITLLVGYIFYAAINRIEKVEDDYNEMMKLKVQAEAADVAKSQFLATVSHEIRTPMNGVLGMLQMLMDTELDETQQDYALTAHSSGKDLISLINEVLDQAKIESGRLELEAVSFDLHAILDNVLSLFCGKAHKKGIEFAVYISGRVPEIVMGDPGRFRQIITNLVGNSIKFTEQGHILVSVHLADEVRDRPEDMDEVLKQHMELVQNGKDTSYNTLSGYPVVDRWKSWENFRSLSCVNWTEASDIMRLLVTVEDTGVGIPYDAQSRIFQPFMQADSSTSRTYGGTGIGLSISKCLVELMHGEIGVVSKPGIGSTFTFTAALAKRQLSTLDMKWYQSKSIITEFQGLQALVVDGRNISAKVTSYHLRRLGILVEITTSLKTACTYISNNCNAGLMTHFDMVLVDEDAWSKQTSLTLPCLINELRQNGRERYPGDCVKIFLLASSGSTEIDQFKSTIDGVIKKPLCLTMMTTYFQQALGIGDRRQRDRGRGNISSLRSLLSGKQILVVDDNVVNRRVATGALKKYGATVTCVESGKDAVGMLQPPHKFDACFMDLQMPEMDGFEATRQVRSIENKVNEQIRSQVASIEMLENVVHWHTPILAMTADVIQATQEEYVKCGMDGYVSKPFEEEQLYSAVASFFGSG